MRRMYDPNLLYEVSIRTVEGRWWFDGDASTQAAIVGAMAAAQAKYPVKIHAFVFMSNHYHAIYAGDSPRQIAGFLGHFHAALARLANRRWQRSGPVWSCRAHVVPILLDAKAQLERLEYILGQGVKAGLVRHPLQWQGASNIAWLLNGMPPEGSHVDRTGLALAGRNGRDPGPESDFTALGAPNFSPLPCWADLPDDDWRTLCRQLADEVAARYAGSPSGEAPCPRAVEHAAVPSPPPSTSDSESASQPVARSSPLPRRSRHKLVHAATVREAREFRTRRLAFDAAFAAAAAELRCQADRAASGRAAHFVVFPVWAFPASAPSVCPGPSSSPISEIAKDPEQKKEGAS